MTRYVCLAALAATLSCSSLMASVSGAIFTTVSDGSAVNANIYDSKCSVYLNGGPGPHAPASAAGLPDGDYFFQVTDPSGQQLLSTDPVSNRRFTVHNGVIVAFTGTGGPVHPVGVSQNHPELGSITIRIANATCPTDFLDSPNNGGTYKAWATPVTAFVGNPSLVDNSCGSDCYHGFVRSQSKTDNFKASTGTATFCLTLQKQFLQTDQTLTPGVQWQIQVTDPLSVTNSYFTDTTGQTQVCGLTPGTYTVAEVNGASIYQLVVNGMQLGQLSTYNFTWSAGQPAPVILFINQAVSPF